MIAFSKETLAVYLLDDDSSVLKATRATAMNAGASAFFIKGVENKEFLAGIKAAADSTN